MDLQLKNNEISNEIINYVIKHNMIKSCQIIELTSFILTGMLLTKSKFLASIVFIIGIFFAIITGEAMIRRKYN